MFTLQRASLLRAGLHCTGASHVGSPNAVHSVRKEFVFLEHYAGQGVMSREIETMHKTTTAKLDIELHRGMDILSPAGFAFDT